MAASPALSARHALVKLLLHIASLYQVVLGVSRDSGDKRDAMAKRLVLGKTVYKASVRNLCRSKQAQAVASNHAKSLKGVCRIILQKKGGASGK